MCFGLSKSNQYNSPPPQPVPNRNSAYSQRAYNKSYAKPKKVKHRDYNGGGGGGVDGGGSSGGDGGC
jgi:hypothetical protein